MTSLELSFEKITLGVVLEHGFRGDESEGRGSEERGHEGLNQAWLCK